MPRYKPGSRIAQMWAAYEREGTAAARLGPSLKLAKTTINKWISGWERERRLGILTEVIKPTPAPKVEAKAPARKLPKIAGYTPEQIALLLDLKASKERGAASMGCSHRHPALTTQLEKLKLIQQYGFGPTAFVITTAGIKLLQGERK